MKVRVKFDGKGDVSKGSRDTVKIGEMMEIVVDRFILEKLYNHMQNI